MLFLFVLLLSQLNYANDFPIVSLCKILFMLYIDIINVCLSSRHVMMNTLCSIVYMIFIKCSGGFYDPFNTMLCRPAARSGLNAILFLNSLNVSEH